MHQIQSKNYSIQESTGGKGKGKGKEVLWRRNWSGHAQQDFGRGSAEQTWEVRERREVWDKEMQEGKKVHGRKG